MRFEQVIGHRDLGAKLRAGAQSGRVAHAQLFNGPEGSGALALALAYARYLHCSAPTEADACGQCSSCVQYDTLQHPDLHWSFPFFRKDGSDHALSQPFQAAWRERVLQGPYFGQEEWLAAIGADRKQLFISVQEAMELNRKLGLKAFAGGWKVLILWLPEAMRVDTANKMLKLIEEPPENTLLIFVAQKEELLLGTIVSRCQLVRVPRLKDEEIAQALQQLKSLPPEKAHLLAHLADGDLNDALKLSQNQEYSFSDLFISWLRHCYTGNEVELTAMTEKICQFGREEQKQFLQYGLHFLREMTQIKLTGEASNARLLEAEKKPAQSLAGLLSVEQLDKMSRLLNDCAYYIERNANQKLLFLDASIQVHKLFKMNRQPVNG